ncbi:MAG: hybrid sensor histidine kinase/response regulator [Anaerolineae bacterium]|nr:hybrid sensor histidine kinase/response regulator [Anaerolineae bacterium]
MSTPSNQLHVSSEDRSQRAAILLVDDDPAILEGVADLRSLYDYNVIAAGNGQEALRAMQEGLPDLIISDIMMPGMDGYEFFEAVRSNPVWTPIPFVFLTARGQARDIRLGNLLGVDAYLVKPFEPDDLLVMVESRLKRARDIQTVTRADVERIKQELITIFSHELRTPLTYIYGYVSLLQENLVVDDPTVTEMLNGVQKGADRLVRLVEDLMLIVRIDSGVVGMEITLRRERSSLAQLIEDVVRRLAPTALERNVQLEVSVSDDVVLPCTQVYLEDALMRIVGNGIKFCRTENGVVTIALDTTSQDGFAEITVSDNGIGIEPAQVDRAFERFSQINRRANEQQGVGLGLSIARSIVEFHGGSIHVESTAGKGSTFRLLLPVEDPREQ